MTTPAPAPNSSSSSTSAPAAEPLLDVLVVGAGPAGLTAATYLARYHRSFVVVDAGKSRARWIPASHNCPGFPHGVGGEALLGKLREQARSFDVAIEEGRIGKLERADEGFIATSDDGRRWRARFVLLAIGMIVLALFPYFGQAWGQTYLVSLVAKMLIFAIAAGRDPRPTEDELLDAAGADVPSMVPHPFER